MVHTTYITLVYHDHVLQVLSLIGLQCHILDTSTSASLVERNMSEILQNLEDFSTEVGFLLSLQQTPVLVVTKTAGDPENKSSMG